MHTHCQAHTSSYCVDAPTTRHSGSSCLKPATQASTRGTARRSAARSMQSAHLVAHARQHLLL